MPKNPAASEVLQVDGITVAFGSRRVLDDVTFSLSAGEFVGMIGTNGAGKTTLLRVILGLQPVTRGRVQAASAIGYVPQKIHLDPDLPMRARDLIGLGIDGGKLGLRLPSRARDERIDEMVALVGAESFANSRVGRLSGGEQQRVLIAHALVSRPKVLLADEPLANLDLRAGKEVIDLLAQISRDQSVAVLLSAHDINPLIPVMDRVVYVANGRAVAGPTSEVVRSDVLTELYGHPVQVLRVDDRILVAAGSNVCLDGHEHDEMDRGA